MRECSLREKWFYHLENKAVKPYFTFANVSLVRQKAITKHSWGSGHKVQGHSPLPQACGKLVVLVTVMAPTHTVPALKAQECWNHRAAYR